MALDPKTALVGNVYYLSDEDRNKFRTLYEDYISRNPLPRSISGHDLDDSQQAPEFYVALPKTSIPAMVGLTPGKAECTIYQCPNPEQPEMLEVIGFDITVYNLGSEVSNENFVQVARDKYGRWWVLQGGTSVSGFWGRLIGKTVLPDERCIEYTYEMLTDSTGDNTGTFDDLPINCAGTSLYPTGITGVAREVNNVDLPVRNLDEIPETGTGTGSDDEFDITDIVVRLQPVVSQESLTGTGSGSEVDSGPDCRFEMAPRWEFVQATSSADEGGYMQGRTFKFDENGQPTMHELILIIDLNAE